MSQIPSVDSSRLASLDIFRGLTVAAMLLVNSPGNEHAYPWLEHAPWHGLTPTDFIFPFFLFIVGAAIPFSLGPFAEALVPFRQVLRKIVIRSLVLFGLGLLLNGFPYYRLDTLRVMGVLQRISLVYFLAALLSWRTSLTQLLAAAFGLLLGYWALLTHVPVPGFGAGVLTPEGNAAAFVDRLLLSGHLYRPAYDPEGLLSTLPAVATALTGVLSGRWLRYPASPKRHAAVLVLGGVVAVWIGWAWGRVFPINKALWTSSYVLVTSGTAMGCWGLLHWAVEGRGISWGRTLWEGLGRNAVGVYFFSLLVLKIQNRILWPRLDGTPGNLRLALTDRAFGTWLSPVNASLAYAILYTVLWCGLALYFHRRRRYLKI